MTAIKVFLGLLLLGCLAVGFFIYQGKQERVVLRKLLENRVLPPIEIAGKLYTIDHGKVVDVTDNKIIEKVLRLAAFYQWTKEDPLFYSPDIDAKGLAGSIDVLATLDDKIKKTLKKDQEIHPTHFLRDFAEIVPMQQDFLDTPSDAKAENLIKKQKELIQDYIAQVNTTIRYISPPSDQLPVTYNIVTGGDVVIGDLKKIAANGKVLDSLVSTRESCLKEGKGCLLPSDSFSRPKKVAFPSPKAPEFLNKQLIFGTRAKKSPLVRGPYRAKAPCWGWGKDFTWPQNYFYVYKPDKDLYPLIAISKNPYLNIQLANEAYYFKIPDEAKNPDYIYKKEKGIDYTRLSSTNPYTCQYLGELAEVVELDTFLQANKPILPESINTKDAETKAFFKEGYAVEHAFFASKYPSYEELEKLGEYYAYAYLKSPTLPESALPADEFLKRYLSIKGKMGNIHLLIGFVNVSTHGLLINLILTPIEGEAFIRGYVYTYRSIYGLFYFPFSPAIWKNTEELSYFKKVKVEGAVDLEGAFFTYHQAIKKFTPDDILRWAEKDVNTYINGLLKEKE